MRKRRRRAGGFIRGYLSPRNHALHSRHIGHTILSGLQLAGGFLLRLVSLPFVAAGLLMDRIRSKAVRRPPLAIEAGGVPVAVTLHKRGDTALLIGLGILALSALSFMGWSILYSDTSVPVTVAVNGAVRSILSKEETVGALLRANGIALLSGDGLSHSTAEPLEAGMALAVERAFPVAVASGGAVTVLPMHSGSVGEALSLAKVAYDADDIITALPFADVTAGMRIQHIAVENEYETVNQVVHYQEETIKDNDRYIGDDKRKTEGRDGERLIVRQMVYHDGELASREVMNQITLTEAINEVKIVGTKFRAQTKLTGDTRPWKEAPKKGEYVDKLVAEDITAYTHTGRRTATGKWPKVGYVAVNPKVIPYGTYMYIKGYGYCYAQDTGAFRHEDSGMKNQIDLFMETEKECRKWGRKYNLDVYIIKWGRG